MYEDRCNGMVMSWLIYLAEKEIAKSVIYCTTVETIWNQLKNRYAQTNRSDCINCRGVGMNACNWLQCYFSFSV
ncbi:hypothetical protein Leryth_012402 [Lithospermum erythrorhizon]|nr:hypothetical protein Leryth_012402 [Lithospermum erythrorhizon]